MMKLKEIKKHRNLALVNGLVIGFGIGIVLLGICIYVFFKTLEPYAESSLMFAFVQAYLYTLIIASMGSMMAFLAIVYEIDRRRKIEAEDIVIYQ